MQTLHTLIIIWLMTKKRYKRKKIVKAAAVSTLVGGTVGALSGVLLASFTLLFKFSDWSIVFTLTSFIFSFISFLVSSPDLGAKNKIKDYLKEKKDKENFSTQEVEINENDENLIEENIESDIIE